MAKPYDLYIRYLFTSGIDDVKAINRDLVLYGLGPITQVEFECISDEVVNNIPPSVLKQIESQRYSVDFMKWMRHFNVDAFWPDQGTEQGTNIKLVKDIHKDPLYKITLQALLIKNVNITEIQQTLAGKFSANYKEHHLILYKEFFFNPGRMCREDWTRFLQKRSNQETHIYFTALTEPVDVLKAELGLYANIAVSEELSRLLRKSLNKANQYLKMTSKESNIEARAWIKTSVELTDKYEKYRSGDSTDFSKSLQMEFEFIEHEFPTPDEGTLKSLGEQLKAKEEKSDAEDH